MANGKIKNLVFDIGNVLIKWDPKSVLDKVFPHNNDLFPKIFKHQIWYDLNLGLVTEAEAIEAYHQQLGLEKSKLQQLLFDLKESLIPIDGSLKLLETLHQDGWPLYSVTDNIHEFVSYLKHKYHFWPLFKGVVSSADVKILKPAKEIYEYLLNKYHLKASECLFIDDILDNVLGAQAVGMEAVQFTDVPTLKNDLDKYNIKH
jgi:putative hydrolase of the HAD superfamily